MTALLKALVGAIVALASALVYANARLRSKKKKLKEASEDLERQKEINVKLNNLVHMATEQQKAEKEIVRKYEEQRKTIPQTSTPLDDTVMDSAQSFYDKLFDRQEHKDN